MIKKYFKFIPFANRFYLYKILNLFLKTVYSVLTPQSGVMRLLKKHQIEYVDIGGYFSSEQYLAIRLSPMDVYGIPALSKISSKLVYDRDSGDVKTREYNLNLPSISLSYDITRGLPLDSDSVKGINMSHILEHFTREEGAKLLKDCYRVLKPGGALRISCPDLLVYSKAYVNRDSTFYEDVAIKKACLYEGLTTYGDRFISKAYDNQNEHKWFYDAESAIQLLKESGFKICNEKRLHETSLPNIEAIEPAYREAESFYVEAVK